MKLDESIVLITGAGGGIGSLVAKSLGAEGARLLLTDIQPDTLARTADECRRVGIDADQIVSDVASSEGRAALAARAEAAGVNVLINVAGVNPFGLFREQSDADIEKTIVINTIAPMLLCRALIPVLERREKALILNFGSTFGSIGYPGFCSYSTSKFAIRGFSEALRRELADTPISVHYIAPRATRTALSTNRIVAMNDALGVAMDAPETVAAGVLRILREEQPELYLGWPERLFARINGVLPRVVTRSIIKQLPVIKRYARAGELPRRSATVLFAVHADAKELRQ